MKYEFPKHINGDTFSGVNFAMNVNGSPLDLTSASIVMDVSTPRFHTFFTNESGSGLSISGSNVRFDEQVVNLSVGALDYEIRFTLNTGDIKTYISGSWLLTEN